MSRDNWIQLCELAERLERGYILLDLPYMTTDDARALLNALRNQAEVQ